MLILRTCQTIFQNRCHFTLASFNLREFQVLPIQSDTGIFSLSNVRHPSRCGIAFQTGLMFYFTGDKCSVSFISSALGHLYIFHQVSVQVFVFFLNWVFCLNTEF